MTNNDMLERTRLIGALNVRSAQNQAQTGDADTVIAYAVFYPVWTPGVYKYNQTVMYDGQPMTCILDHDSTNMPDWTPSDAPSLWTPWHARSREYAQPYVTPIATREYMDGEWMLWTEDDGNTWPYECIRDNTSHSPAELPTAWVRWEDAPENVTEPEPESDKYPEWVSWSGKNEDLYDYGERVTYNGETWESTIPNNHWEPSVHGWIVI